MKLKSFNGLYIVSKRDSRGELLELSKFEDILKDEETISTIVLNGLKNENYVGDDGLEVTLAPGSLIHFSSEGETKEGKPKFRLRNCGATEARGQAQYEFVLHSLGLGDLPKVKEDSLMIFNSTDFKEVN